MGKLFNDGWVSQIIHYLRKACIVLVRLLFRRKKYAKVSFKKKSRQREIFVNGNSLHLSETVSTTKVVRKKYKVDYDSSSLPKMME